MEFSTFDGEFDNWQVPAIESLFENDSQLRTYERDIRRRYGMFEKLKNLIENKEGMDRFTRGYENYGVIVAPDGGIRCQEWVPNARALYLQGEFNNFDKMAFIPRDSGLWELQIPPESNGSCRIRHMSELKLVIETKDNRTLERISPWAKYVVSRNSGREFQWLHWNPPKHQLCQRQKLTFPKSDRLRIYEAHVGIASENSEISSYQNFTRSVLPRIRDMGYNCVLLMAIMEYPRFEQSNYQLKGFFSTSSRFGTPEDLRELINAAHNMGLMVMMDVMHNQASLKVREGFDMFHGNDTGSYFFDNDKGYRREYGTRTFNYTRLEILRFLMSNLRYYLEEFCFDGFRFNKVTSMFYGENHGGRRYDFKYDDYFGTNVDRQSMVFLMLANHMIHRFHPNAITIAEDHSEFPSLCRPIYEGGFGFDYRTTSTISDLWQKFLKERRDEEWDLDYIFRTMTKRRKGEKYIAFIENHEQNPENKMTISRYLMNREDMSETRPRSLALDRGLSLHKMIRLITHALAGEGYMNFMGNEFGHPDWIEFPSPSNNNVIYSARRLFQLADDESLRYKYLNRFDAAMNKAEEKYGWLRATPAFVSRKHDSDKVFVFERAGLLFLFNFHPTQSYIDYRVGVEHAGRYEIVLDSDSKYYGGHGRTQLCTIFNSQMNGFDGRPRSLLVGLPSRCAIVMANRDFHNQDSYCRNSSNQETCQQYYGSDYGPQLSRCSGSGLSYSYPNNHDGKRAYIEEKHHKCVSFHDQECSYDQYKCDHGFWCRGPSSSGSCFYHYPGQSEFNNQSCDCRNDGFRTSKYKQDGYKSGTFW